MQPASLSTPPLCCDLTALTSLRLLQSLEIATTARVNLPLTPRSVSLAALAWPKLGRLALSVSSGEDL